MVIVVTAGVEIREIVKIIWTQIMTVCVMRVQPMVKPITARIQQIQIRQTMMVMMMETSVIRMTIMMVV